MKTNLQIRKHFFCGLFALGISSAYALQPIPDIAQSPLELTPTVNPNVMILFDDSGSMDFEIMTPDVVSSGLNLNTSFTESDDDLDITERPGCEIITAAFGGYAYGVAAPTNEYIDDSGSNCYVAPLDDFRFRSALFNALYFDPTIEYLPWVGFNSNDVEYGPIDINAAPFDPFDPSLGTIDLLAEDPVVGFMRYYVDVNGDGAIQSDEEFLLSEVSPAIQQNFANWFSYYRSRHLRAKALLGKFIAGQTGTQMGLVRLNVSTEPSLPATEMNADLDEGAKRILLDELYSTQPDQLAIDDESSPLLNRYFATAEYLADRASSVFPANVDDPAAEGSAGECQANHIIVSSDGFRDFDGSPVFNINEDFDNENSEFDGGAFADPFPRTFADIAIRYYEADLRSATADNVPVEQVDINRYPSTPELEPDDELHQHIKTHVITAGPADALLDASQSLNFPTGDVSAPAIPPWEDPRDSDFDLLRDLVHAAYNARGLYLDTANDVVDAQLPNLSSAVATGVGSTTPVAINTQVTEGDFVLFRTFFDASSISGDMVAQLIDIDGTLDETPEGEPIFLWSAANELDQLVGDDGERIEDRFIITYSDNDGVGDASIFDSSANGVDAEQIALLEGPAPDIAGIGALRLDYLRGDTANEGENFTAGEFRIRPETTSTGGGVTHFAKLGTIANSTPVFIGLPSAVGRFGGLWPSAAGKTYFDFQTDQAGRDPSLIVGANDGMVHIFDAETGRERFAYVPELVFPELFNLANPDFRHQFFVDATPSVNDAYIKETASAGSPSWNTIAIGGLGAGGRGYYALNLTQADQINSFNTALDTVMWEFGPEDDPGPGTSIDGSISDLGLTFGKPIIAMSNAIESGEQQWVAIFGNGYNSTGLSGNAVIYMLFIDKGLDGTWNTDDVIKIDTGVGGAVDEFDNPNGIADVRAIDVDGNGTVDRLYAGDLRGNLHVVDVSSDNPNLWESALNRFILFEARNSSTNEPQPITTRPIVVPATQAAATSGDPDTAPGISDGFIVIFSTGSFFTESDSTNTDIQSIYGVFDDLATDDEIDANTLVEQMLINDIADTGDEVRLVSDIPVSLGAQDDGSFVNGWFINFDVPAQGASSGVEFPGERAVRELVLINDVLFINTVIPQENSCDALPGGFGLALNPFTGSAGSEVIFDTNNDSEFDEQDNINIAGELNVVVGTRFDSTPSSPVFSGTNRIVQQTDGRVIVDPINPDALGFNNFIGRRSWREVVF